MGGGNGVAFSTGSTPRSGCVTADVDAQETAGSYVQALGK